MNREIQQVGLSNIIVDPDLQSRVATNLDDAKEFSEAMLRGDVFPPVDVFDEGTSGKFWLADGFHRVAAAKAVGANNVRATIHVGSRRDAIIFSAGANRKCSIPRTNEDKKKSAFMLFADDEWKTASHRQLAQHVGVGACTIRRWQLEFCSSRSIPPPLPVSRRVPAIQKKKNGCFYAKVGGKQHYLSRDEGEAIEKARSLRRQLNYEIEDLKTLRPDKFIIFFATKGIRITRAGFGSNTGLESLLLFKNWIVSVSESINFDTVATHAGRLLLMREKLGHAYRMLAVSRVSSSSESHDIAKRMGIEFVDLKDFIRFAKLERDISA